MWVYYNQPGRWPNFLAVKFAVSARNTSWASAAGIGVLDDIAQIKRSDALLCDAANFRLSPRLLAREGWERHTSSRWHRNYIKRFYGSYPQPRRKSRETPMCWHDGVNPVDARELPLWRYNLPAIIRPVCLRRSDCSTGARSFLFRTSRRLVFSKEIRHAGRPLPANSVCAAGDDSGRLSAANPNAAPQHRAVDSAQIAMMQRQQELTAARARSIWIIKSCNRSSHRCSSKIICSPINCK